MALRFGTSGVRGLVTEMTDFECALYTRAFVRYVSGLTAKRTISIAGDLRSSTPRILAAVAQAIRYEQLAFEYCGTVPTPTLANQCLLEQHPGIMVTGSHIPDDRNGIKYYLPGGEVLKKDEQQISIFYSELKQAEDSVFWSHFDANGALKPSGVPDLGTINTEALERYMQRYIDFFPERGLAGQRLVLYTHSSVARDLLHRLLEQLGAEVIPVGRSDRFVPVDTEAVDNPEQLQRWVADHRADALVSTDGDGDRPLVVTERGQVIRGDVLGILVSRFLGADSVTTPVSSNTAVEHCGWFSEVRRTRIGSPYVIAALIEAVNEGRSTVVGYEANGGFLTATDIELSQTGVRLAPLPTRDAVLPIVAVLLLSIQQQQGLSALLQSLPSRFTWSGLLRGVPTTKGQAFAARFENETNLAERLFGSAAGVPERLDFTDGTRIVFAGGLIIHLRPSGNAPEFRCYTEAGTESDAELLNTRTLEIIKREIG